IGTATAPSLSTTAGPLDTPASKDLPWWNDAVFYEIFVRSFRDSDGDGIGDFNGITKKLEYLKSLGISGIWLMPIHPSPSYHGYDVTDYYEVNPEYGTMEDFKRLLDEAHNRDIRIIIDLVLNHSSSQHPWFESAVADEQSPYRDWYIWSESDPGYNGPWGQRVWHPSTTGYYYGLFVDFMPDLNYGNPAVTEEMEKITTFWLTDVGVDGFRLDAAKHLIEDDVNQENTSATHEWFKDFRPFYKSLNPDALAVGEVAGADQGVMASYTQGDQLDLTFDFGQAAAILQAAKSGNAQTIKASMKLTYKLVPDLQYATFITNHDQNRVMSELGGDPGRAKVAASLLLTTPGVPFIYYGEEIGMSGVKPDELIRTPMQWSGEEGAGFTDGTPWEAINADYPSLNVAAHDGDSSSLLEHYRMLIRLRNEHESLRTGEIYWATSSTDQLAAYLRSSPSENIFILINLSTEPVSGYELKLNSGPLTGTHQAKSLLEGSLLVDLAANDTGGFDAYTPLSELPPYSIFVIQLIK
ncbi:MAG TPA: alpha-amylase family glycosyl hydrolase, partial [Anaerolineales bacterium]|nr:alpha-amylase family glycosyl hydrolase [Anaerolineales bacterium]